MLYSRPDMLVYAITIALSAFLLFQIQPMIAKMILPWFGGSAAVWITAMLFFQTTLLGGYLYAHWSVRKLTPRTQTLLHMALLGLSVLFLPIAPSLAWKPLGNEDPLLRILGLLAISIGLPYFLLSTTSPLIQAWYARKYKTALPYRLFGLSNLASLLGLLAYPVFVEPNVTLRQQSLGWSGAYIVFICLGIIAAIASRRSPADACEEPAVEMNGSDCRPPKMREHLLWLLFAACASTMLLAVTNHLTQNVASIPFLWVLPLSLYLLTFILTFDFERLYRSSVFVWLAALALVAMAYGLSHWNARTDLRIVIPVFSCGLFLVCMFCHGELVKHKPAARYLTSFYLMLSLGGAIGGLLVGLAAPKFLPGYFELPITLVACALLLFAIVERGAWKFRVALGVGVTVYVAFAAMIYVSSYQDDAPLMARNFYGGLRVQEYDKGTQDENRMLVHGTVDHGAEFMLPHRRQEHLTYYGSASGIGLALQHVRHSAIRIGVIGLGAGSLASYARPGDTARFYEINPLVETIARKQFYYLSDCQGKAEVVLGDGRLSLEHEPIQNYDLFAVDAFSGDAVPVHLLTKQALELYFRHLKPDGILALHITNTHLDLVPVVTTLAETLGKHVVIISNEPDAQYKVYRSQWALVSTVPFTDPAILHAADKITARRDLRVWTDDYNNLFQILK